MGRLASVLVPLSIRNHVLGRMTSFHHGQRTVVPLGRFTSWMNIAENALGDPGETEADSTEVIDALTDLFILRGVPAYIRSDNGQSFIAEAVRDWIQGGFGQRCLHRRPGSPWEGTGTAEAFNGE